MGRLSQTLSLTGLIATALLLAGCLPAAQVPPRLPDMVTITPEASATAPAAPAVAGTPLPTREPFGVGQIFTYSAQTGDTLVALAAHFNTNQAEILSANAGLAPTATIASGTVLRIPAYWFPLGGSPYKIITDGEFVYGPTSKGFDVSAYIAANPGYLRTMSAFVNGSQRTGGQTVQYVAEQYSINPRLLLALMEWRSGALSNPDVSDDVRSNPFGNLPGVTGFYSQLTYVAEQLTVGYYAWRNGTLTTLLMPDSTTSRPDYFQTAGTVAVQYLFSRFMNLDEFNQAVGPQGFGATYLKMFGDPFAGTPPDVIPGNLSQPALALPFDQGEVWTLTGGPHPIWGDMTPWGALDIAPPGVPGCAQTDLWARAVAGGVIVRSNDNSVVLDLDGDGFEGTGWVVFYFHVADRDRIAPGTVVKTGDPIGHPSCEGGLATGTHVHIGRKYNGEWIPADGIVPGVVPFDLGGWVAQKGAVAYGGRLMRLGVWANACVCSTQQNTLYWVK
jgi:murein DD-endopeptidase MepM/ murein hydrolase activator NlpD